MNTYRVTIQPKAYVVQVEAENESYAEQTALKQFEDIETSNIVDIDVEEVQ